MAMGSRTGLRTCAVACVATYASLASAHATWGWQRTFSLDESRERQWTVDANARGEYKYASTKLLLLAADVPDVTKTATRLWDETPQDVENFGEIEYGKTYRLALQEGVRTSHFVVKAQKGVVAVFAEHNPIEYERGHHYFRELNGSSICPESEVRQVTKRRLHGSRSMSHDHDHSTAASSRDGTQLVDEHCRSVADDGTRTCCSAAGANDEFMANVSKLLAILLTIASALLGVVIRLVFPALDSPEIFGYVSTLCGGMFISMAIFHILPETLEHAPLSMMTMFTSKASYLSIMVFVMLGFLSALFFDRVFFGATGLGGGDSSQDEEALKDVLNPKRNFIARSFHSRDGGTPPGRRPIQAVALSMLDKVRGREARDVELAASMHRSRSGSMGSAQDGAAAAVEPHADGNPSQGHGHGAGQESQHGHGAGCCDHHEEAAGHGHGHGHGHGGGHGHGCGHNHGSSNTTTGAIVLMCSLSFHSIFEGVLIGTADSATEVWVLVTIIAGHKWAEVLAISNTLTPEQRRGRLACILLSIFALASPLGTVLGWIVEGLKDGEHAGWASKAECILNAMSVGSLFYVGFVEVIPEEFTGSKNSLKKFGLLCVGIVAMYLLTSIHVETAHGDMLDQHS